MVIDLRGIGP